MPQSQTWPADRAVLLVHGVGNATPGSYDALVEELRTSLGDDADGVAVYVLYYDAINDWIAEKTQAAEHFARLVASIRDGVDTENDDLGDVIADFAGDVLWPILLADARHAVRAAVLGQLQQIVLDGEDAGIPPREQQLSIIAHSLGCFHVYEALHAAARDPRERLSPASWEVQFANVIYMASPVQLIGTVARAIRRAVPQPETLFCAAAEGLAQPSEATISGRRILSARRTVSITGDLDPVGGHFLRARADWAYMALPGQESYIDDQHLATVGEGEAMTLAAVLRSALREGGPPVITPENPHDWAAYVARHGPKLRDWITA